MSKQEYLRSIIANIKSYTYCYEITVSSGSKLFLTSGSNKIKSSEIEFLPNSGLSLTKAEFNDSAQNYAVLEGVFDANGISKYLDLTNSIVKISVYIDDKLHHFITYYCTNYTKHDLYFILYLQPESIKYNQPAVKCYSKNCRAIFGDHKCKANKALYTTSYKITAIINKTIIVQDMTKENGYFTHGTAMFDNTKSCVKIIKHYNGSIELDKPLPDVMKDSKNIQLVAGCDKKFLTCCNKFDNAVNFRGEPFIPMSDFLQVP